MRIIGISGKMGTGKDTFGYGFQEFNYKRTAFADTLKDMARQFFFYENSDNTAKKNDEERKLLQHLGTEMGRIFWTQHMKEFPEKRQRLIDLGYSTPDDFWVMHLDRKINMLDKGKNLFVEDNEEDIQGVYIPDVRFENEASFIESKGLLIRVERPGIIDTGNHPSEISLDNWFFGIILVNNGSIDDLISISEKIHSNYDHYLDLQKSNKLYQKSSKIESKTGLTYEMFR